MNTNEIIELYRYNDWANNLLLRAATSLSPEEVNRDLGGSYKSIRDVIAHITAAEWAWLERWNGISPQSIPDWVAGDIAVLADHLSDVETRRNLFLQQLSDAALSSEIAFQFLSGAADHHPLHDLLIHVVDHSSYHRGQLASKLRQAGAVPPPTGFIAFKAELRG
ncbi:MAG TPA: DinB family protein [Thermoanaerobaculia bacterium]|nr:DinB family protein [Thermoanaerobaculia bacterium]